jgi:hypothetical protein
MKIIISTLEMLFCIAAALVWSKFVSPLDWKTAAYIFIMMIVMSVYTGIKEALKESEEWEL